MLRENLMVTSAFGWIDDLPWLGLSLLLSDSAKEIN